MRRVRAVLARIGPFGLFGVVSLLLILALGVVLAGSLQSVIRDRALAGARQDAELVSQLTIQPLLSPADLSQGLSPDRIQTLDQAVKDAVNQKDVARVKIWNRDLKVVYSDDHSLIGRTFPSSDELDAALAGRTASEVDDLRKAENVSDRAYGKLLEVYVPLRFGADQRPAGAFEIYLPYQPVEAAIDRDTRKLYLLLLGGLTLLYLALFPIVAVTSRLRRRAAEKEYEANHDALTGLPNRVLFHLRLRQALATEPRQNPHMGIMIMDLDRFKEINDTLGHHAGDLLLREVAGRLQGAVRRNDSIARLGGDEFAVLLEDVQDPRAATEAAERLLRALEQPFAVKGLALNVGASIGIALYPQHGEDAEALIQRADVAMYVAKRARNGYEVYVPEHDRYTPSRLTLVSELRRALDDKELLLYYQPKADLRTGRVDSVEALVRWQHPQKGLLLPGEFIPLAEQTGTIKPLSVQVLEIALQQCRTWEDAGLRINVAVNLSGLNLLDLQLPDDVARLLTRWKVLPDRLDLEITETTIMADPIRAAGVLTRLSALGVGLSIDDFGTGYSSLTSLRQLLVKEIKIDQSFVKDMAGNENDALIVRSIIDLGKNLKLRVVAEGVETEQVWQQLLSLGCDQAQGFFLCRPLPANEVTVWLQQRARTRSRQAAA